MSVYDLPTNATQKGAIAIELIFCTMAMLVTAMRIYARQKTKNLGSGKYIISTEEYATNVQIFHR